VPRQIRVCTLVLLLGALTLAAVADEGKEASDLPDPAVSGYLTHDYIFVDAPQIEAYLSGLIRALLAQQGSKLPAPKFLIRSSEEFDIFTDASKNIVISTELLRQVGSEDELSAALGHEISHQILRHPQSKNAARAFPMGLDTISMIKTAANRSQGARGVYTGNLNDVGQESLANTQAASLIWSDIFAPAWNRKQERAADQNGFLLMRAAGYDPASFGALFQKLHTAAGQRSARMELLKKVMLARANKSKAKKAPATQGDQMAENLKNSLTEGAAEAIVTGLASFNREYDTPDERQKLLAEYARAHREKKLSTARPVRRFKETLRQGAGARLLAADAAAIKTLNALTAKDMPAADKAVKSILPATAGGRLAAPHLSLAVGAWYHLHGNPQVGEQYAKAWLTAKRPPAQAYVWVAYYQAMRKEFTRSIATLEQGRTRVGNSAPFLPHLVSLARAAGQNDKAEAYTLECLKEDQKNTANRVASLFRGKQVPSGLYADCVQRLGHEPKGADNQNAAVEAMKHPVEATKNLGEKIRGAFHRDK